VTAACVTVLAKDFDPEKYSALCNLLTKTYLSPHGAHTANYAFVCTGNTGRRFAASSARCCSYLASGSAVKVQEAFLAVCAAAADPVAQTA
jgi:hypothetical protein